MTGPRRIFFRAAALAALVCAASVPGRSADLPMGIRPEDKRSGYHFQSRETQAMQDDDLTNPG